MASLLDHGIRVRTVISNTPDAPGLKIARERGIKYVVGNTVQDICDIIERLSPDLICLAGFMRILPRTITDKYQIMNIHPSLLPRFPGLHAQRQAIEAGASYSGCTVHMVDGGVDTGKIVVQKAVPVLPNDTVEMLSDRILEQEHVAYPKAVEMFIAKHGIPKQNAVEQDGDRYNNSKKQFSDANKAIKYVVASDNTIYLWNSGVHIVTSDSPPDMTPHIVSTPADTAEILHQRLANLADWNRV